MAAGNYPAFFSDCIVSQEEALKRVVKTGTSIGSGFATSEPSSFYHDLWDFIIREDIHDLNIRQGLFMAPHKICVGDALESKGLLNDFSGKLSSTSIFGNLARTANTITKKLEGLHKLIEHYKELQKRKITFTPGFLGPANNIVIPLNPITKTLYPDYAGRNTSRMGITDMQSIHFPDGLFALGYDADNNPKVETFVMVLTPPDENGDMSHGPANGVNGTLCDKATEQCDIALLIYVNPKYPFTRGYGDAINTVNISRFESLAKAGKLIVVEDETDMPSLPPDSFKHPLEVELTIAEKVVNHIEMNNHITNGRAIQVGLGGTGVLAIKALKDSSWTGRCYTEMLEPFTLDLFESGKIAGTHLIELDGRRTMIDGKMVCTFSICEENSGFYKKLHNNPNIIMAPASRIVIEPAFYGGLGINNCLGVDFYGHVNSGGRDNNHHSGVGGAAQIIRGLSKGGVGYLCLKSVHKTMEGKLRSSIFPMMPAGTPISLIGPDLMGGRDNARIFLVTEHGVAQISGKSQSEFIKSIISVADPQFRDWLKHEAYKTFRILF